MILHISVDPISGPVSISVFGESCVINSDPVFPSGFNIASPTSPSPSPVRPRFGSVTGMVLAASVALLVGVGFGTLRSGNAPTRDVAATVVLRSPPSLPSLPQVATAVRRSDQQDDRVEQALNGQPVITPPPSTPAKSAGNPFGLE